MKKGHILGICSGDNPDFGLLRDLGVKYVRLALKFPFADANCKTLTPDFERGLRTIERYASEGFKAQGKTFCPGISRYDPRPQQIRWMPNIPDWAGSHTQDRYYEVLDQACECLASRTRDMVDLWEIANEPNLGVFCGPLNNEQIDRFLLTSARAVKRASPQSRTDINISFLTDKARRIISSLYAGDTPFDYLAIDGYFGCWHEGGPQDWVAYIDETHRLSGKPILISEWGYSSIQSGPITDDPERKKPYNQEVCREKAWSRVWRKEHSPQEQADYVRECLRIFADHPHCIGNFIFRWDDTVACWQCGQAECPAETAWGIVSVNNQPKPAYHALKQEIAQLFA